MEKTCTTAFALLLVCFFSAGIPSSASAQCGGSIIGLGGVNTTPGNPFQAEVKQTITPTNVPSVPSFQPRTQFVARDSQGRLRSDRNLGKFKMQSGGGQEVEEDRHLITICDPATHELITLDTLTKTAALQKPISSPAPAFASSARSTEPFCGRQLRMSSRISTIQVEDLGHKTIQGLDAQGTLQKRTLPNPLDDSSIGRTSETEVWCSEELGAVLLRSSGVVGTPGKGTKLELAMVNIQRAEPNASLFQIPPEYKIVERVIEKKERPASGIGGIAGSDPVVYQDLIVADP